MKILAATAGPVPAKEKADYVVNIAKRLGVELTALHVLAEKDRAEEGEEALNLFSEAGQNAQVNVTKMLKRGDIVSTIVESAEEESAALIIVGASRARALAEWISAEVMTKTTIPVVVISHETRRV